jgi:O-antigen/teichoic acid export membrane protein
MRQVSWTKVLISGKRYQRFPRIMVPDQLINTFTGSVHILFIGYAFGPTQLGYVSLIFSALYLPVTVVSSSIKDVFRQRASVEFAETGNCRPIFVKLLMPVTLAGLAGFGLLYIIAPWIFVLVFGPDWASAGLYAQLLIPMFFFNFVSMSLGGVLVFTNQMNVSFWWQVTSLIMGVLSLLIGILGFGSVTCTLIIFTIARSIGYIHYAALSYKYAIAPGVK